MNRLILVVLLVWASRTGALSAGIQPFTTIYSFGNAPANPRGNLTLGPDGNFYGTTTSGGQYGDGAVFRVTTNGDLMTLASFGSFLKDGTEAYAGLTLGADGNFYGTTIAGGTNQVSGTNNTGTIFRVTTNGTLSTVASFTGFNGSYPECKLIIGPNGSFYGTTAYGGVGNAGTVFQVTTNGVLTTLASFSGTNGAMPQAGLTLGLDGNFYGTTTYGGISNVGTIFQVTPGGSLKTLVSFNNTNGAMPYGQLTLGSDGDLYGTTAGGGINTGPFQVSSNSSVGVFGTVFRVTTNGTLTTLADLTFLESYGGIGNAIGWNPYGQLIQGADGGFYGTTSGGGTNGSGTIFRVSTNGTLDQLASLPNLQYQFLTNFLGFVYVNYTTNNWTNNSLTLLLNASVTKLYDFPPLVNATNSTGAGYRSGLTLGPDGNFYSAVSRGGASGFGTIIRVATNGITTPLASFSGNTGSGIRAGLTLGPDGNLYGAAQLGGVNNIGTLFKWSRNGSVSTLHSFDWRPDGANPNASLTLGPDGNLYGTALNGGTNLMQTGANSYTALSYGTVFRLSTNGVFTPVVYFNGTNGANPYAALTLLDGIFYGTTAYGGISNSGTVFQLTTNGTLTVLDNFTGANGSQPYGRLAVGPDGHLYGMTGYGGISNVGTVFEISTQGLIHTILHFTGTNGANPQSGLFWNSDGYFYGVTDSGGSKGFGTIFKLTPGGALTTLASFGQTNANGSFPEGDLIKGPDGNLYGATPQGGTGFNGTVFRLDANSTVTTLFSFPSTPLNSSFSSGYRPYSGFILYTNGNFIHLYGTAFGGGNNGGGTIFQVNLTTSYAVPENTSTLLNPLTNDVLWTTGGTLSLASTSTTNGGATIDGTRILVLPATNFTGSVTLAYTFTDGSGQTNASLIALLVTNIPPVANPDSAAVGENSTANPLSPLANDLVQTPGGTLGLVSVSTTNGTAVISGTNVLFTPNANYVGPVTVNYTVTDHIGGTNGSYITVAVTNAPALSLADLSLSASVAPVPVSVGSNLVYSLTVSNAGPFVATGVVISNQIPAGVSFVSATGGAAPSGGVLLLNLGSLAVGATASAELIVRPTVAGQLANSFQIFANETDPVLTNNFVTVVSAVTNPPPIQADLSLSASATPEPVGVGSNLVYSISINNQGPNAANGVALSSQISTNCTFVSATGGASPTNGVLLLNLGSLAEGANISVQIVVQPTAAGTLTNTFQIFANELDPMTTNDTATVVSTVSNAPIALADLELIASVAPQPVGLNSNLVFSVTVANLGPSAATGVVVSNRVSAGEIFVSATGGATASDGVLLLNLGSLAAGATNSAQVILQPTSTGQLTNLFQVYALTTDPVLPNNSATVVSTVTNALPVTVDLALSLTAAPNPVSVGAPLTYSLAVTNNSSATATGVVVSNTLPANVTLFSLLPSQGSATNQGNTITYSVGNLPNGEVATLAIVVLPEAAGSLTNLALVTSAQTDLQPANDRATNVTTAMAQPITNLVLTVLSPITLNPQTGLFEQRIQVANGGPATPASVLVTVAGLAANAKLYNATGTTNGLPYVQSASPLGVGSNVVFLLEYYVPTRVAPTNLIFTVQAGPIVIPPAASGTILSVSRTLVLSNGNVLVEFGAVPGQVYAVQYSSDMTTWLTAVPVITAPANRVQWIDAGPPQTVSSPAQQPARYYRVVLLSAH